jgi:hypothetical protein
MLTCNRCNTEKEESAFSLYDGKYRARTCKKCRSAHSAAWNKTNRASIRKAKKKYLSTQKGKLKNRAWAGYRKRMRKQQQPSWADTQYMKDIYENAREASEVFGMPFHVDHIVPLQGEKVSGFHVETNLQVLPALQNLRKGNSHG